MAGGVSALAVQKLHFDALAKGQRHVAALALEALEHGHPSDAWARCEALLRAPIAIDLDAPVPVWPTDLPIPYAVTP